mmetsp:Transcript_45660/g.98584  ORF Transcript_45660/g.98584 Transcript_45660/m.98584 type:complete len:209 (+) Transcript_45660:67-693(+)
MEEKKEMGKDKEQRPAIEDPKRVLDKPWLNRQLRTTLKVVPLQSRLPLPRRSCRASTSLGNHGRIIARGQYASLPHSATASAVYLVQQNPSKSFVRCIPLVSFLLTFLRPPTLARAIVPATSTKVSLERTSHLRWMTLVLRNAHRIAMRVCERISRAINALRGRNWNLLSRKSFCETSCQKSWQRFPRGRVSCGRLWKQMTRSWPMAY